jgi:hypothetical protein
MVVGLMVAGIMLWGGCAQQVEPPASEQVPVQDPAAVAPASAPEQPAAVAPMPVEVATQEVAAVAETVAATAQEAIDAAQQLQTAAEQVTYLLSQAETFFSVEKYDQVVAVTQHILQSLDANSQIASDLLAQAQSKLQSAVQGGVESVTGQLGTVQPQTE